MRYSILSYTASRQTLAHNSQAMPASFSNHESSLACPLDSLLSEAYDDSSYDSVVTLHHTDRENRAMASVFSYSATSRHFPSGPNHQLTQSPRAEHGFHSSHHFLDSISTIELIRLLIGTTVQPRIRNAPHPFMEPRRMTSAHP